MMTAQRWRELEENGGSADLSARAKWRLSGGDRIRYLNGQVTQDVRKVRPGSALRACVTDAKGRLSGDVFVRVAAADQSLLLDAEAALRETLGARLERYIVADDVELEDVTDCWRLLHFFGATAAAVLPEGAAACRRLGVPGYDLWLPATVTAPAATVSAAEWETLRILRGIARHPNELHEGVFPPEAGLEAETMDYAKGCYLGQEVLSRIRSTGKMPRTLVKWALPAATGIVIGAPLADPGSGAVLGQVTSVAAHPLTGRACGLAFLKQGALPADSRLLVGDQLATILALNQEFPIV